MIDLQCSSRVTSLVWSHWKIEQSSWKENQCANACLPIAPTSECFHANMERVWGTALSSIYIIIPTLFVIMAIILFISEVHFLQRFARRKRVRYTLYWILGIYPGEYHTNTTPVFKQTFCLAGMICHLIALYIPRSVIYMEFAVDIWVRAKWWILDFESSELAFPNGIILSW